eukprot:NODE_712_length_1235_cov_154.672850_g569_i0.p1 GENE.NODE_712_length_1235_cov_154.672850_g569_i0~~NODE_712_length_1235_cov_154.672850_g569_i0.p1  ORF type:complete len:345 (-),score=25.35 NODE_712_length_1235_cov_154.672850_g569_i0:141-1175(-)
MDDPGALQDTIARLEKDLAAGPTNTSALFEIGVANFKLENFARARECFQKGLDASSPTSQPPTSKFQLWIRKCDTHCEAQDAATESSHGATVSSQNSPSVPAVAAPPPASQTATAPPQPPKVRHQWYQAGDHITVEYFAKKCNPADVSVSFSPTELLVRLKLPDGTPFEHHIPRLCQSVLPEKCSYTVLGTKVEVKLAKATQGGAWTALEYNPEMPVAAAPAVVAPPIQQPVAEARPQYPTSSLKRCQPQHSDLPLHLLRMLPVASVRTNWDSLAVEEEKPEGDAALNKLFQDIFSRGDEDTRRAMVKSFVESGGTVLSTNWNEVGSKHVDGQPPKGMEFKKID